MRAALFALVCLLPSGCAVHQLHNDQDKIRTALLDLYTDQIMDNLVRASNGMPIIQIDYTNATATITSKQTASFGEDQAVTNSSVLGLPAATQTLTRTIVSTIRGSLGAENTNQVAVTGTPLITSNEVYDAYLRFLAIPGSLVVSDHPPPPCAAHISRKCGQLYYWVPVEYRGDFFKLSLLTTAQRGRAFASPDEYFTVKSEEARIDENPGDPRSRIVTLIFKSKVPNDSGHLTFDPPLKAKKAADIPEEIPVPGGMTVESRPQRFVFDRFLDRSVTPAIEPYMTDRLVIYMLTEEAAALREAQQASPITVRLYQHHHRPELPTTDELLERANFQLQQIQFNQLRGTNP